MATIIKASGERIEVSPKNGTDFSLSELKEIVGGYIEVTYTQKGRLMIVNEEGKIIGLPENAAATLLHRYSDPIVGDVLVCDKTEVK